MKRVSVKRKLFRKIPVLSRVARALDALEEENRELRKHIPQPVLLSGNKDVQADPSELSDATGLPLPPASLREWVAGTTDLHWFLEGGKLGAQTILSILAKHNIELEKLESVLDFGCGCGRVIRHLHLYEAVRLHGTDCNQAAIVWCDENLNFAEFGTNRLEPPTRYRRHSFDLIYAFSVFTHLTESLQATWMHEMRRILKPLGLLIITVHGDYYLQHIPLSEQAGYQRGALVVTGEEAVGQNQCLAYHPEPYVRNILAKDFEVVDFFPEGALGNPRQDAYLLR
jgi:SAM-dependent methyltransferase